MPHQNYPNQNANVDPTNQNKGRKDHRMSERQRDLILRVLTAWFGLAGLIGSGFLNCAAADITV